MKLAPASIPYRAFQKATSLGITLVFIASIGAGIRIGSPTFLLLAAGILVATVVYEIAYYKRFAYELTDDTFDIRSGVFSRREREIPYGRIQNVDISRNVLQRLVGLSAVNIETAGGGSTEAVIQYVSAFEGKRLQQDIRRYKHGETTDSEEAAGEQSDRRAEEEVLFEIAPSELALSGILSFDPRVPGLILAVATGSIPFISPIVPVDAPPLVLLALFTVLLVGGVLLAWIVGAISAVVNYWGFRLTRSNDELRYERGLLQRYSGTIPFDKIQAMTIKDNPLKRRAGYATLAVETAGYAPGQASGRGSEAAVPIASLERVEQLADEIAPYEQPTFKQPPKRIRRRYLARYLIALGAVTAVLYGLAAWFATTASVPWYLPVIAALATPIAAHYKWVHRGYSLGDDHLLTRNGFWSRETKLVAYYRIQTVIDTRTIFQRRWSVATVIADTAGSLSLLGTDAAAVDIDQRDAERLRTELADRLRTALADRRRQRAGGFEWLDEDGSEDESPAELADSQTADRPAPDERNGDATVDDASTGERADGRAAADHRAENADGEHGDTEQQNTEHANNEQEADNEPDQKNTNQERVNQERDDQERRGTQSDDQERSDGRDSGRDDGPESAN